MTLWSFRAVTGLGLLLLISGCATTPRRADIPLGEWSGRGVFVYDRWSSDGGEKGSPAEVFQQGTYPTQLKIERAPDGGGAIRIEILSRRGKLEKMQGDRTHIVLTLKPGQPIADGAITPYRLAEFGFSLSEEPPEVEKGPTGPTRATCLTSDGDLVLRIHYMEDLIDTFRFRGNLVYKDGVYDPHDGDALIHWSEVLRRQR